MLFRSLRYLFMNVELATLQADQEIMHLYADLVDNQELRTLFSGMIDKEFELTMHIIDRLFSEPLAVRRPMQLAAIQLRKAPLEALHRQQINLLRQWRNVKDSDPGCSGLDTLLGELFLSVNAIAGGVRNTG